ncbi:MAG: hypothetical protein K6A92_10635 [Lachnospiraceae bacterium]|nr:hypothetical protein [Lachnospiraceae bacterium]
MRDLTDREWEILKKLIPLMGKQKEWEISFNRHHEKCLWDREEDAPYSAEEGLRVLMTEYRALEKSIPLSGDDKNCLEALFRDCP